MDRALRRAMAEMWPPLHSSSGGALDPPGCAGGRVMSEDLTAGQVYNVSTNGVGAAGTSDWSDVGSLMVI